jgi:type III secretory pathway component EscV
MSIPEELNEIRTEIRKGNLTSEQAKSLTARLDNLSKILGDMDTFIKKNPNIDYYAGSDNE